MKSEHKEQMKSRRRNIALTIAYDGSKYHGFQRQTKLIAVQNVLEDRLKKIFGDTIELAAAGRTDAGVHAIGQVVNFFTDGTIPIDKIPIAAAGVLPNDIVVRAAWEVDRDFSARHSAKSKIYIYRIHVGATANPLIDRYAWHVRQPLDDIKMIDALKMLIGVHDFSAFRSATDVEMSPIRMMFDATLDMTIDQFSGDQIMTISLHANGFLYHMVRNIVGSVVEVGRGRLSLDRFAEIIEGCDRNVAPPPAPACGLCLYKVFY